MTTPYIHHALVFVGSVLLGLWLRSEQVAHAWDRLCNTLQTDAHLIEVRRVEGNGDIAVEEMSWEGDLWMEVSGGPLGKITLSPKTSPYEYETFLLELEEGP